MEKTIDFSGWPMRAIRYVLTGCYAFGAVFLGAFVLWRTLVALDVAIPYQDGLVWPAVFTVCWVVLTVLWARHVPKKGGDWWGPIPRNQYLGRFAAYGGLARHSWETAIDELPDGDENDRER